MKKNVLFILLGLVLTGAMVSCNDWIEETNYTYSIATKTFYNTPDEASSAVMGVLDNMRSGYNSNWFASLEINTEFIYPKGVYQNAGYYEGITNTTHITRIASNWQSLYRAIMDANTAIAALPEANAMSQTQIAQYIAEFKFLRAFNYFQMTRVWGGLPIRTEANMYEWDLAKSTSADVYKQIVADLQEAVSNCPDSPRIVGTPDKNAAKAVLAQVYMFTGDYASAMSLAKDVINSGKFSLIKVSSSSEFNKKVFGEGLSGSSEEVFYIKTCMTDNKTWDYLSYTAHPKYEYEPGLTVCKTGYYTHYTNLTNPFIAEWDKNDLRYDLNIAYYVFGADAYGEETCLLLKYRAPNASGSASDVNPPMVRYTDVLLTYAEAAARTGNIADGVEVLNQIRRRAYGKDPNVPVEGFDYKASDYPTFDAFLEILIKEESYETFNEAKHWFFENRLGKWEELVNKYYRTGCPWPPTKPETQGEAVKIAEKAYLWKIPDAEFEFNKAMDESKDQNPGYLE